MTNKEKALALVESFESGNPEPVNNYLNREKYIQHNHRLEDGVEGLRELLKQIPPHTVERHVYRSIEDGDFVAVHSTLNFFGPKVMIDIYRFEEGKIVEHWDNIHQDGRTTLSGHTMVDGESEIKDKNKTQANKQFIKKVVQEVFIGRKYDSVEKYFSPAYTEHDPDIADGLAGLKDGLKMMTEKHGRSYQKLHMILCEGNFVVTVFEGSFDGKHVSFYDLFRIEGGKIAEHWDIMETIPPMEEWKNGNGKF